VEIFPTYSHLTPSIDVNPFALVDELIIRNRGILKLREDFVILRSLSHFATVQARDRETDQGYCK